MKRPAVRKRAKEERADTALIARFDAGLPVSSPAAHAAVTEWLSDIKASVAGKSLTRLCQSHPALTRVRDGIAPIRADDEIGAKFAFALRTLYAYAPDQVAFEDRAVGEDEAAVDAAHRWASPSTTTGSPPTMVWRARPVRVRPAYGMLRDRPEPALTSTPIATAQAFHSPMRPIAPHLLIVIIKV